MNNSTVFWQPYGFTVDFFPEAIYNDPIFIQEELLWNSPVSRHWTC